MDLTSQYSLAGINLFSSEQDLVSQLPSEDLRQRFLDISSLVSTFDNFVEASSFERLLRLDFTSATLNTSNVSTVLNILTNKNFGDGACKSSSTGFATNFYDAKYTLRTRDINPQLARNIINTMRTQLEVLPSDLEPLSSGTTTIQTFRNIMMAVCTEIFKFHYTNLQEFLKSANATLILPTIGSFEWLSNRFCTYASLNASRSTNIFHSSDCNNTSTYFQSVHRVLLNFTKNPESYVDNVQSDPAVMRIFLSCFFPFFMFDFILNNIAKQNMDSLDKAPRYYMLRRFSVLAAYMCLFYVAFSLRDIDTSTSRYLLAKINDDLFAKEMTNSDVTLSYTSIHQDTTENAKLSRNIVKLSEDITASRGNLNKALTNDLGVNTKMSRAKSVMYMWVAFTIVTTIGCGAMYFLFGPEKTKYTYMFIVMMLGVLLISGIVSLSSKV